MLCLDKSLQHTIKLEPRISSLETYMQAFEAGHRVEIERLGENCKPSLDTLDGVFLTQWKAQVPTWQPPWSTNQRMEKSPKPNFFLFKLISGLETAFIYICTLSLGIFSLSLSLSLSPPSFLSLSLGTYFRLHRFYVTFSLEPFSFFKLGQSFWEKLNLAIFHT